VAPLLASISAFLSARRCASCTRRRRADDIFFAKNCCYAILIAL